MRKIKKQLIAGVVSLAMVLTSGAIPSQSASAAAKKIKLSATKVTVNVGKSKKVTVKNAPKKAKIAWSSKNKKIAKVTKAGKITGVKKGSTKVTCKVTYTEKKKKKTKKLTVKVTVKKAAAKPAATTAAPAAPTVVPATTPAVTAQTPVSTATAQPPVSTATEPADVTPTPFFVKSDSTSNIGEEREVSIVGGISDKMTVKDNGTVRKELSSQYLIKNEMGEGINLGNTMEATKALGEKDNFTEATDFEQNWGAPITTQEYIDAIHSYGFNTLRIPVGWSSMVSKDGTYTIDKKMLGRVEEIANYALNNGMYVIINDHWDYGWWGQFGSADETVVANAWKRYESYWNQISERFKDYSDHLILESANEELGSRLNDAINEDGYSVAEADGGVKGILTEAQCYETTNQLNQKFVDIVRASGGNNANRHLLIAGYNTNIDKTVDDKFIMPEDTEENGKTKLSVSVHFYDPWGFCGDDATGSSYTEIDKTKNERSFDKLSKFTEAGYGVIIGEFGVCNPRQDGACKWLEDTIQIAADHDCLPVLWDTPGMYFDRNACKMNYKDVAEMYNRITGANGETDSITANTGTPTNDIVPVEITDQDTPVWSWEGRWAKNDGNNIGLDGNKVTKEDITKFVQTDSCTDESKISFNSWGYQTFLHLDWDSLKKPCIKVTFETDTADAVGKLKLATVDTVNGSGTDEQGYEYDTWAGKGFALSDITIESLKEKGYLYLTFGNAPIITGIYVYDLGQ